MSDAESVRPTRRQFLGGVATGAVAAGALTQAGCGPAIPPLKTRGATATTTVCPFCGVGCGQIVSTQNGRVINIEGDPARPVSEGTLCSKGAAAIQVVDNPRRLQKVLYRAPGGKAWEEKRSTTSKPTCSSSSCARSAWCTSSTRPDSDTAPRSPDWRTRWAGQR